MKARGLPPCFQPCLTLFHPHFSFQHCSTLYHPHSSFLPSLNLVTALTQSCSGLVPPLLVVPTLTSQSLLLFISSFGLCVCILFSCEPYSSLHSSVLLCIVAQHLLIKLN